MKQFDSLKKEINNILEDPNNFTNIESVLFLQHMLNSTIYKHLEKSFENQSSDTRIDFTKTETYMDNLIHQDKVDNLATPKPTREKIVFVKESNGVNVVMLQGTYETLYIDKHKLDNTVINVGYLDEVPEPKSEETNSILAALMFGCQITENEWNTLLGKKSSPIDDDGIIETPLDIKTLSKEDQEFFELIDTIKEKAATTLNIPEKLFTGTPVEEVILDIEPDEVLDEPLYLTKKDMSDINEIIGINELVPEEVIPPKPVFQLTEHQQTRYDSLVAKIDEIISNSNAIIRQPNAAYFLTVLEGAAGTGKTTMMVKVLEYFESMDYKVVFCSPTHQALGVIRNTLSDNDIRFTENNEEYLLGCEKLIIKTLASFLGIKMVRDLENGTESFTPDPKAPVLVADILCIDESSMISKDQLKIILQKLHVVVKCVMFIGDEVQLDSPSDNNESNGIFRLPLKFSLEEVVRQAADNKILQFAWELRGHILNKACNILPTYLLNPAIRNNENVTVLTNQAEFLQRYFNDPSDNKLIAAYTNKITNEYNDYIRQMKLIGQGGEPLDIDIDYKYPSNKSLVPTFIGLTIHDIPTEEPKEKKPRRNIITSWNELKEFYVGEELIVLEPNQKNGDIIHQTGEKIRIEHLKIDSKEIKVNIYPVELHEEVRLETFTLNFWHIEDVQGRVLRVIVKEDMEKYNEVLQLLMMEAKKSTGKYRWAKYYDFKEKFIKVNKTFAYTLHKLQGSTCENIYVDARDLDKFWGRMPIGVYKLIYIALTRSKNQVVVLI